MNIIIRETSSEMRAIARKALRGNWVRFAVIMALYYLLLITLPLIIDELIPAATISQMDAVTGETTELPMVSTLYTIFLAGPFSVGLASVSLQYFRKKELHAGYLFDGFEYFLKCIGLVFLMGFYIFLWTLLFIIPGVIAAFRYSQAFYILADHPEYGINQCITLSKEYMRGNKTKYLCFELSFIGWEILATMPATILTFVTLDGIAYEAADYVLSIPFFFFLAYNAVGRVVFYELASGNLMAKPRTEAFAQAAVPASMETSAIPTFVEPPGEGETSVKPAEPQQEPSEDNDEFHF